MVSALKSTAGGAAARLAEAVAAQLFPVWLVLGLAVHTVGGAAPALPAPGGWPPGSLAAARRAAAGQAVTID